MGKEVNLKMTGERVVPHDMRTVEEYIQYLRHHFVYEYTKGELHSDDRVLEIGFGEGYGTKMLAETCREIVAIDIEKDAVEYARNKYGDDKCSFQWYEGHTFPFDDGSFDAVVSFQVIEHIKDDNHFISEIYRILKDGGRCYLTTPNRETRLKPGQKPWNRFHMREYSHLQLADVLSRSFGHVDVFGVKACNEILKLEANRIHQGFFIGLALKLGIRKWIPQWLDPNVARFVGMLKGQKKITNENLDFKQKFSTKDFHLEKDNVPSSLDLFGHCKKATANG